MNITKLDRETQIRCTARYTGSMPQLAANPHCCLNTGHVGDHTAVTGYRWPNETPIRAFREAR